MLYLDSSEIERTCGGLDAVGVVREALAAHARGDADVPSETQLRWRDRSGEPARSLAMPARVDSAVGVKVINSNPVNPGRGLPRASGVVLLLDPETARPVALLDGARISALRTAAVTMLAAQLLGAAPLRRVAVIGAGVIGAAHLELIVSQLPGVEAIAVCDRSSQRARALAERYGAATAGGRPRIRTAETAEEAIEGAELIVPATTTSEPYIRHGWLSPGALLVNVSLDDVLPEVILAADRLYVDDWQAVEADRHRLLGRMAAAGTVLGPSAAPAAHARRVDAELGSVVIGAAPAREHEDEVILVNPFGIAIEDVALATAIVAAATELGLGIRLRSPRPA